MIAAFAVFTVIVLAILWLFQTVLLDDIYSSLKLGELESCAEEVVSKCTGAGENGTASTDALIAASDTAAKKYSVCISTYEISTSGYRRMGKLLYESHVNAYCFIHGMGLDSGELLNQLYREAAHGGGELLHSVPLSHIGEGSGKNVIFAKLIPNGGSELLLLFNTELMPLDSTVETIKVQLIIISIILFISAVALAVIFSGRLSKPIREMSGEASKLALGNYNVNFDGGNCTETVRLSETLNRAAYELSRLDKMQKDLIANVSHDLRTPLTMIAGYTEAMRDLPGEATPENMQIVIDETERLTGLVNDMLEVSRYQNGTQTLKTERINITEIIRTTLERYARLREKEGYTITFEAGSDAYVIADKMRILQVLYNLINNAVNYTGEDKTVLVRQTVSGGEVTLEVIDTGCGIPEDELPLVWERYYKVNDFHKRANMGTGLGLSIVKSILLLHGAEFGVKSTVGKGSDFWFRMKTSE